MLGRPSGYSAEIAGEICDLVAQGSNLNKICALPEFPSQTAVFKWLKTFPDFAENYARARELRADRRSDRIDGYVELVAAGELDPQAARVMIDAEKWQAAHEAPRVYGDRTAVDLRTPDGISVNVVNIPGKVE